MSFIPYKNNRTFAGIIAIVANSYKTVNYLIGPRARHASVLLHAPAKLDVFVGGKQVLQAVFDVRHHPGQGFAAHDDAGPTHAEVLVVLEAEQTKLLLVPPASLSDEHRLTAIDGPEQRGQPVGTHVHVVVGPHEPFVCATIVVPHMLQHQERLLLRRVRVVHRWQPDEWQVGCTRWQDRRFRTVEHHAAGHTTRPRAMDCGRPGGQVSVGGHHADEQQRFGWTSGSPIAGHGSRSTATTVIVVVGLRRLLQRSQHVGPAAIAIASATTGVQPESAVRSAERVADKQSKNDAGQHVRQTPSAIAGRFLLAAGRR